MESEKKILLMEKKKKSIQASVSAYREGCGETPVSGGARDPTSRLSLKQFFTDQYHTHMREQKR